MIDFINNNSSAIFAVITVIVTLFIPYFGKIIELKYQKRETVKSENKAKYVLLIDMLANFQDLCDEIGIKYNRYLMTLDKNVFHNEPSSIFLSRLRNEYIKVKRTYTTNTFMDLEVEVILNNSIEIQQAIVGLIETCGYNPTQETYDLLNDLRTGYSKNFSRIKNIIRS